MAVGTWSYWAAGLPKNSVSQPASQQRGSSPSSCFEVPIPGNWASLGCWGSLLGPSLKADDALGAAQVAHWCIYNLNGLHGDSDRCITQSWWSAHPPPPAQTPTELLLHGHFYL